MNKITNVLGAIVILAAVYTVVIKDVTWTEAQFGIYAGIGLVYTKNSKLVSEIKDAIKK